MLRHERVAHPHVSEISASRQADVKAKKAYNSAKGSMGLEVLQLMPCKESTSFETTVPEASFEVLHWYSIAEARNYRRWWWRLLEINVLFYTSQNHKVKYTPIKCILKLQSPTEYHFSKAIDW